MRIEACSGRLAPVAISAEANCAGAAGETGVPNDGDGEIPADPDDLQDETVDARVVSILLVDDDKVDVIGIRRSLARLNVPNTLVVARNGFEALDIMRGHDGHKRLPAPYIVLLDLNMPRMTGVEFLKELREDPSLRQTLVFVMTTSASDEDRQRAYDYNIVGFFRKQSTGPGFTGLMTMLVRYWQAIVFPD